MSFLDNGGLSYFWNKLNVILSKKLNEESRGQPACTFFTGITGNSGTFSIESKMTYAVGIKDGVSFYYAGTLHSYVNAFLNGTASGENTKKFSFTLQKEGFQLVEPTKISGITNGNVTPSMMYPVQYTVTPITNGLKFDCEFMTAVEGELPVSFNLHIPMVYRA